MSAVLQQSLRFGRQTSLLGYSEEIRDSFLRVLVTLHVRVFF